MNRRLWLKRSVSAAVAGMGIKVGATDTRDKSLIVEPPAVGSSKDVCINDEQLALFHEQLKPILQLNLHRKYRGLVYETVQCTVVSVATVNIPVAYFEANKTEVVDKAFSEGAVLLGKKISDMFMRGELFGKKFNSLHWPAPPHMVVCYCGDHVRLELDCYVTFGAGIDIAVAKVWPNPKGKRII